MVTQFLFIFLQFVILEDFKTGSSPEKSNVCKRNFNNFDNNNLNEDLNKTDQNNEIYNDGENVNDVFSVFYKCLSETVDRHTAL